MAQVFGIPPHPYYPQDAHIPNYVPNTSSLIELLVRLASLLSITVFTALWLATRFNPRLSLVDKTVFGWFVLCGSLHCFFEGYFLYNHATLASSQDLFAQLWKEYALSDSRYLTSDPFMLCVEAITIAVWGPLSFATAVSITRTGSLRYPLQIIVSVAHLYGVALYYSTCYVEEKTNGVMYSRPEFQYFWVYFVGFNAPWVLVPAVIIVRSIQNINKSTRAFDKVAATLDRKRDRLKAAFQ
ncbi:Emopamil-binding protein [Cryphonectria parasitica EP155]|uniref:Emopamil-binding protein n=1 Tax=Cryphonectria parasitica (strain ATCC 38755 / EP155) TaxID=660469 RepID=A0A9P4YCE3_CRYP1|nr:Emopamil-binding protein [Cryphonectria parasitica EP155]KAF3770513.1 Emopamil-binding protein [Cryphonectria parasitica EP155]